VTRGPTDGREGAPPMEQPSDLDAELTRLDDASRAFDAGDGAAPAGIAASLRRVFHQARDAAPLLSRMKATYARVASCVPRPPYPQGVFLPLVNVSVNYNVLESQVVATTMGRPEPRDVPRFSPLLDRARAARSVQAPDWWKTEPVFIIAHSRVTRRDLALWAVSPGGVPPDGEKLPQVYEAIRRGEPVSVRVPLANGAMLDAPFADAHPAALRQVAYEVLRSPELLALAGRSRAATP